MAKIRKVILDDIIEHIECVSLDEAAIVLLTLKRKYESEGWSDIQIERLEISYGNYDYTEVSLVGEKIESEKERIQREREEYWRGAPGSRQ